MFFLIKIILVLAVLSGVFVYGETVWDGIKERVLGFTDPELQKASLLDSFRNNFSEIENIVRQVNENLDNPEFDKKAGIDQALELIEESKGGLEEIGRSESESSFIEKTFENLNDLKDGVQGIFTGNKGAGSQSSQTGENCRCSSEN